MRCTADVAFGEGVDCPCNAAEISRVCEFVLREENVEQNCFVSVSLVSDDEIRALNRTWREIDRATDVISLECERPEDVLSPDEPCELGDIVLAPAYIERQARQFGTPYEQEFKLLLVHGMLHLLGYDHLEEEEAQMMERREDEILALLVGEPTVRHTMITRHQGDDEP